MLPTSLLPACNGFHRRCLHHCGPCCLCCSLLCSVHLRVRLHQGLLRSQERLSGRLQGPDVELGAEWQPGAVHAGVEPHRHDQVRDVLVLARPERRPDRQVDYMIQQNLIPRRELRGRVPRQQSNARALRRAVMDDVEAADVRRNDPAQVLREIEECKKAYPSCFVRVLGFDNVKQVQFCGFLIALPN